MTVLQLRDLGRHYGAVRALDGVDLEVDAGEVVGLMGDNGAGKSTLLRLVAGSDRPDMGEIRLGGESVRFGGPADARARGVEIVYQGLALCDNLTAAENLFLGREPMKRLWGVLPVLDRPLMVERATTLLAELESDTPPRALVSQLSGGQRQAVAIARTRLARPRLVLLDEPTAAISVRQVDQVLRMVRRLAEQGIAVVLVSHRMQDVFGVADRVVVLRRGRKVADVATEATDGEQVTALITGALAELSASERPALEAGSRDSNRAAEVDSPESSR